MSATNFSKLIEAAFQYATMGWPVIPVNGKKPFIKEWPEKASDDPATIKKWLSQYPKSNLGVVTGKRSGIFVLDVDAKYGGIEALDVSVAAGRIRLDHVERVIRHMQSRCRARYAMHDWLDPVLVSVVQQDPRLQAGEVERPQMRREQSSFR